MPDFVIYDLLFQAIRLLFLLALPMVAVVVLSAVVIGAVQSATSINDAAISYGVKLLALGVLLYVTLPNFTNSLLAFARYVFSV